MAEFIFEILFFTVCGFVGHVAVKALTLGNVNLDWGTGSESVLTEWIGFFVLLFSASASAGIWA